MRALVTGGSRGIGAAVVRALAARGDTVAVHCRHNTAAAAEVVAGLPGEGHCVVAGDVADPAAVAALVRSALDRLGGVDILVNNAGIYREQPIASTSLQDWLADWRRVLDVNVQGAATVTWHVVRHLLTRPEGPGGARIVMVGSRGAYRGEPDAPAYGASKAAVHALAQSLAVSLAPHGIAVSAVAPGFTATDLAVPRLSGDSGRALRAQSPFQRVATPDEVASAVLWLTSRDAEWASGAVLDLNGASYLH